MIAPADDKTVEKLKAVPDPTDVLHVPREEFNQMWRVIHAAKNYLLEPKDSTRVRLAEHLLNLKNTMPEDPFK